MLLTLCRELAGFLIDLEAEFQGFVAAGCSGCGKGDFFLGEEGDEKGGCPAGAEDEDVWTGGVGDGYLVGRLEKDLRFG